MLTFQVASRLSALKNGGHAIAYSPRGDKLAYAGGDPISGSRCIREVVCWKLPNQLLWSHEERGRRVNTLVFSPDGERLLCAEEGPHLTELNAGNGQVVRRIEAHPKNSVNGVDFAPDGSKFATASWDMTVKLWRADDDAHLKTLVGEEDSYDSVRFSPDGRQVVAGSATKVTVWTVGTGQRACSVAGHGVIGFSPDAKLFVAAGQGPKKRGEILFLETSQWTMVRKTVAHTRACNAICFSPDGRFLATSGDEKQIVVWEMASGRQVAKLKDHVLSEFGIVGLAWSPDAGLLACTDTQGVRQAGQVTVHQVFPTRD
jgi:WD40 repeat protein